MKRIRIPAVGSHVKVQWDDSEYLPGWRLLEELDGRCAGMILWGTAGITYGRLLKVTRRCLWIGSTLSVDRKTGVIKGTLNPLRIPRRAIENIVSLDLDADWPMT